MKELADNTRKKTGIIAIIGTVILFVIRCMDFYGVKGVSVYSGLVSVEKYWIVYAVSVAAIVAAAFVRKLDTTVSFVVQVLGLLAMLACDFACFNSGGFPLAASSIFTGFIIYIAATLVIIVAGIISACKK